MGLGGFVGPALGVAGAATGIALVGMGANAIYNGINNIAPQAKKTLKQRG